VISCAQRHVPATFSSGCFSSDSGRLPVRCFTSLLSACLICQRHDSLRCPVGRFWSFQWFTSSGVDGRQACLLGISQRCATKEWYCRWRHPAATSAGRLSLYTLLLLSTREGSTCLKLAKEKKSTVQLHRPLAANSPFLCYKGFPPCWTRASRGVR
jgi:hypothetical protein